jgi:hypothetical protein
VLASHWLIDWMVLLAVRALPPIRNSCGLDG